MFTILNLLFPERLQNPVKEHYLDLSACVKSLADYLSRKCRAIYFVKIFWMKMVQYDSCLAVMSSRCYPCY